MVAERTYNFSFTTMPLRVNEMAQVAEAKLYDINFNAVQELGKGRTVTARKLMQEINKRLRNLTQEQMQLLVTGDLSTQKQIAYLATCKTHAFIRDFAVEVLREKLLLFDYTFSDGEYLSFFRRKAEFNPELEQLTELSKAKIRQVLFKMLQEASIIDDIKSRTIQPQLLDPKLQQAIANDNKEWLKVFFISDSDIDNTTV